MRRPRFTTRGIMKFVATFALILAMIIGLERRKQSFLGRARESGDKYLAGVRYAGSSPEARERVRRRNEYYRRLNEKYVRAARYPWLPVAPDPPGPE